MNESNPIKDLTSMFYDQLPDAQFGSSFLATLIWMLSIIRPLIILLSFSTTGIA